MGTERSDKVHENWRQSSEKFDYFVTGITGALCAYISQTFKPEQISFSPNTLELVSLLILVGSVYAGFKRIESAVETHRHNHHSLHLSEQTGQLMSKFEGQHLLNEATGEILPAEQVVAKIKYLKKIQPEVESLAETAAQEAGTWYTWRNRLLASGFCLLVAAKVLGAYV